MKSFLIALVLLISTLLSANNDEIKKDLEVFVQLSAAYLYEVDDEELPNALMPHLVKYKHIKAMEIIESTDDELFMSYYKDKDQLIFNKSIPQNLKELLGSYIQLI